MRMPESSLSSQTDGCRALGKAAKNLLSCSTYRVFLARIFPGHADFLPLRIGIAGQVHQLAKVFGGLLAVTCAVGGAGGSPERAETVGRLLECSLELVQGSGGLRRFSIATCLRLPSSPSAAARINRSA